MTHLEHFTFEACKINICFVAMHWFKIVCLCHMSYLHSGCLSACYAVSKFFLFFLFIFCSCQIWERSAHYDKGTSSRKIRWCSFPPASTAPKICVWDSTENWIKRKKKFFFSFFFNRCVMFILVHGLYNMWGEPESHYSLKSEAKQTPPRHHTLSTSSLFPFPLSLSLCSTVFTHFLWLCN